MPEKVCSSSLCLLGWLQSVNPVRNLYFSCSFLLKSGFLENMRFIGQQVNHNKDLLVLVDCLFSW